VYRSPRPINIDTADIDVTTPRKRTDRVSRDRDDPQQGTIKRGRTVVRIHTKRLKENPALVQNRKKTPGEKLVEKFLIKDKATEEAKRRKLEEDVSSLKHVYRDNVLAKVEEGNSTPPRRKDAEGGAGLIGLEGPKEKLAKKQVPDEEEQDVPEVTQSEALDILLSETESETLTPPQSKKRISVKDKENKSNTIKKRPKKRDKGSTIKTDDSKLAEVTQKPVEKSLLQRRNTVKNLRRNSRDVEPLVLVVNESETSIPSTSAGPLLTPASSTTSLVSESTISTPFDPPSSRSVCSTPTTPPVGFLSSIETVPLEVTKSVLADSDCFQRDTCSFKAKDSDCKSKPNICNLLSVEASVENAGDVFKKIPLKFVVDEIKVEETPKSPKSPKLFRYEVTVDEVADKKLAFRKQGPDNQSKYLNENGIYEGRDTTSAAVNCDLKQAGNVVKCESSLLYTQKEETVGNCSGLHMGKTVEIIPKGPNSETVSQVEVSSSKIGEDKDRQITALSSLSGNNSNEKKENREILTAASGNTNIPSVSPTSSNQHNDGAFRLPEAELKREECIFAFPKEDLKTSPTEKKLKRVENFKDKALMNKLIINREETETFEVKDNHRNEKDACSKKTVESSKIAEKNSSRQIFENLLAVEKKNDKPDIPAWKKALIAKTHANNASKLQDLAGLPHESNLKPSPVLKSPNKDISVLSGGKTATEGSLKSCFELPVKEAEPLSENVKTSAIFMSTAGCSESSRPKITEQQETGKIKCADNSTSDETDPHPDKSEHEQNINIQVTEKHETGKEFSGGQKIDPSQEVDTENEMKFSADLNANKGHESTLKIQGLDKKVESGELLSAGKTTSAETHLENVKESKYTEMSLAGAKNTNETKLKESKPKANHAVVADEMKPAKVKVTDSKLKPSQTSSEQNSSAIRMTECKTKSSGLVKSEYPAPKTLDNKLKSIGNLPIEGKAHTTGSTTNELDTVTEVTSKSPVEKIKSAETEISSMEEGKEPENREMFNDALKTPSSTSVKLPAADMSVETKLKPLSVGNESELEKIKLPQKKVTPTETKVLGHPEFCETSAVEKEKPGSTSAIEKQESAGDAATVGQKLADTVGNAETNPDVSTEEQTSSEEETDSEEETESETETDDGEEVTRPSQRASTSSSEDSGFDSLPTSVPGSPAYNTGPNSKGILSIF
jgi:hypothetical protein